MLAMYLNQHFHLHCADNQVMVVVKMVIIFPDQCPGERSNNSRILSDVAPSCCSRGMRSVAPGHEAINLLSSYGGDTRFVSAVRCRWLVVTNRTVTPVWRRPTRRRRFAVVIRLCRAGSLMSPMYVVTNGRLRLCGRRYPSSRPRCGLKVARPRRGSAVRRRRRRRTADRLRYGFLTWWPTTRA